MNETLMLAILLVPSLVIAIVFHEVAHGWVAHALGDPTAKLARRLSLNPIRHVDPVGTLLVPGALALAGGPIFGWAKPVPVMKNRLDNPRFGMMAVAAAGPGTNLLLAIAGAIVLGLTVRGMGAEVSAGKELVITALNYFILINVFLAMFNLLPIPPFDGSHIEGLLPREWGRVYRKFQPFGLLIFFALVISVWLGPGEVIFREVIIPPVEWAREWLLGIAVSVAEW
jgi:Zn-dependent protease